MSYCAARTGALIGSLVAACGCGHGATATAASEPSHVPLTALGPGDVFEARVYGEEELSGVHRVASDGTINFPLVGKVAVNAKTAAEVSDLLTERLRAFVKEPYVSIFVKEFNSKKVYVIGQVQRPGTFAFEDGMNIIQAITLAGGFGQLADQNGTLVTRIVNGHEERMKIEVQAIGKGQVPNFSLEPGDIVYVPETLF